MAEVISSNFAEINFFLGEDILGLALPRCEIKTREPIPDLFPPLFLCFFPVVTGATDGIGKSYAEEVRLLLVISFLLWGGTMTHAHTHHVRSWATAGESSYRPINMYEGPHTHTHTHFSTGLQMSARTEVTSTR